MHLRGHCSSRDCQFKVVNVSFKSDRMSFCISNKSLNFSEKTDVPFFLPPTIFSRTDTVQHRLLKNEVPDVEEDDNFVKVKRKNRSKYSKIIQFSMTEPVPIKPNKAAPDLLKSKLISQEQ